MKKTVWKMLFIISQVFRTVGTVCIALLLSYFVNSIIANVQNNEELRLTNCLIISIIYALFLGLIIFISELSKAKIIENYMEELRRRVISGILNLNRESFHKNENSKYVSIMNQDMNIYEEHYLKNIIGLFDGGMTIIAALIFLCRINWIIAIVSLALMSVPSIIPRLYNRLLAGQQRCIAEKAEEYNQAIVENLNGYDEIKCFEQEDYFISRNERTIAEFENAKVHFGRIMGCVFGTANMASVVVQFAVMFIAGIFAIDGKVSVGNIIAITQLTGQVITPAFQMSTKISQVKSTKSIRERLSEYAKVRENNNDQNLVVDKFNELCLSNICAGYDSNEILRSVDLKIESGKKYAIIGESGSGKSTLLKVICGYMKPSSGRMLVDKYETIFPDALYVEQDIFLFNDTIRNNITMYHSFSDNEIEEAIKRAGLSQFIREKEYGLDDLIVGNGINLSGGEKQRIVLARAFLHNKKFLLLDESFSALDINNAREICHMLINDRDMTCICVLHNLDKELLSDFDNIIVLEKGKIYESGKYNDLLNFRSLFYNFVNGNSTKSATMC